MTGTWESVGFAVGAWYGAAVAIATLPVVVVDGPLPIADAVWIAANIKNTQRAINIGMHLGKGVDNWLADEPNQELNVPEEEISMTPSIAIIETKKSDGYYRRQTEAQQTPEFYLYPYSERDSTWPEWND